MKICCQAIILILMSLLALGRETPLASAEAGPWLSKTTRSADLADSGGHSSRKDLPVAHSPSQSSPDGHVPVKAPEFSFEVVTVLSKDDRGDNLQMPAALFFDRRSDELYLINGGDNRIVVYSPDYFPQESLGKGRGLDAPTGGYVDEQGNLLIPQSASPDHPPRITILNPAFLQVKEIPLAGVPDLGGFAPQEIALGADGLIYLAGLESNRVLVLTPDGGFRKWFEVGIDKNGEYRADVGGRPDKTALIRNVVVDSRGNLFFLSEETSRVYVFDAGGRYLFTFGVKGGAEGKMSRPRALAIDEQKKCIYVVDYMRHTVLVFDFTGTFRFEFGGKGWGEGWFNYPVDIVLGPHGQVVVADFFNQRVQVIDIKLPIFPDRPPRLWQVQ